MRGFSRRCQRCQEPLGDHARVTIDGGDRAYVCPKGVVEAPGFASTIWLDDLTN